MANIEFTGGLTMHQYKVLIIEDDLNAAQSISNFLVSWGFQNVLVPQESTTEL